LKNNLKDGLTAVERVVSENTSLPILKNVLIKTFNNKIKLTATNLEFGISKLISGKIIEEGGITVPFDIIYGIISNTESDRIQLETDKKCLFVKTDNYEAKIQGLPAEEYPIIPKIENSDYYFEIENVILKKFLNKVIPCVQISEIRPEISGVLFDFQITIAKLVATDSFRLAEQTLDSGCFKTNFNRGFKIIVPLKTFQEFIRVFPDDNKVVIQVDPHQVRLAAEDLELISRLIDGEYPDYNKIIPKEAEAEIQMPREYFINALKLVSNLSGKINDIKLRLKDGKKVLEVYSANQYLGENNYLIPVKFKGEQFQEVSFNWRYLMNGLKVLDSEQIIFSVNGEAKPAALKNPDDNSYFYILMPIKGV
jgi:DNA polymerase-3 subunit beta